MANNNEKKPQGLSPMEKLEVENAHRGMGLKALQGILRISGRKHHQRRMLQGPDEIHP